MRIFEFSIICFLSIEFLFVVKIVYHLLTIITPKMYIHMLQSDQKLIEYLFLSPSIRVLGLLVHR